MDYIIRNYHFITTFGSFEMFTDVRSLRSFVQLVPTRLRSQAIYFTVRVEGKEDGFLINFL